MYAIRSYYEVGATNRTHDRDYENAINAQTALLLRVHCSNYRVIGFTCEVEAPALVKIGRRHGIRITSYNVCYTKLLRTCPLNLPAPGRRQTLYFVLRLRRVLCF